MITLFPQRVFHGSDLLQLKCANWCNFADVSAKVDALEISLCILIHSMSRTFGSVTIYTTTNWSGFEFINYFYI